MKSLFLMLVLFGLNNLLFAQSQLEVIVKGIKTIKAASGAVFIENYSFIVYN